MERSTDWTLSDLNGSELGRKLGRREGFATRTNRRTKSRFTPSESEIEAEMEPGARRRSRRGASLLPGSYLIKLARSSLAEDNATEALEYASQAVSFFQRRRSSLELAVSLHLLAEAQSRVGDYEAAIASLRRSVEMDRGDQDTLLAVAFGYMQLGGTLALIGRHPESLAAYRSAFEVQQSALGQTDPRVAETCRFLAEAYLQAMQLEEAEELCKQLLQMHDLGGAGSETDEAGDRRMMALACSGRGDHDAALGHLLTASHKSSLRTLDWGSTQACIGDTLAALGRDAEARAAYQLAVEAFSLQQEKTALASVYLSLSELDARAGHMLEAKRYCEAAAAIYDGLRGQDEELASGLVETAAVYEALGEPERARSFLKRAVEMHSTKSLLGLRVLDEARKHLTECTRATKCRQSRRR